MKLLIDFLPIILFFAAFRWGEGHKDALAVYLTQHIGFLVSGGVVSVKQAPVFLATLVVMIASVVQITWMKLRNHHIDKMLWVSSGLAVGLGLLTFWFNSETFIKWKPTLLYWIMGGSMLLAAVFAKKNLIRSVMGEQMELTENAWKQLNLMWMSFLIFMGALNLYVAFNYSTETWVDFKTFGAVGVMLVFIVVQAVYISRHVPIEAESKSK